MPDVLMGSSIEVHVNFGQLPSGEGSRLFRGNAAAAATMPIRFLTVWYGMNSEVVHASGSGSFGVLTLKRVNAMSRHVRVTRGAGRNRRRRAMPAPPSARRLQDGSKTGLPRRSFRLFPLLILQLSDPDPQGLDALLAAPLLAAYSLLKGVKYGVIAV